MTENKTILPAAVEQVLEATAWAEFELPASNERPLWAVAFEEDVAALLEGSAIESVWAAVDQAAGATNEEGRGSASLTIIAGDRIVRSTVFGAFAGEGSSAHEVRPRSEIISVRFDREGRNAGLSFVFRDGESMIVPDGAATGARRKELLKLAMAVANEITWRD